MDDGHIAFTGIILFVLLWVGFVLSAFRYALDNLNVNVLEKDQTDEKILKFMDAPDVFYRAQQIIYVLSMIISGGILYTHILYTILRYTLCVLLYVSIAIVVPAKMATKYPLACARFFVGFVQIIVTLIRPLIWIIDFIAYMVLRIFGINMYEIDDNVTQEEIMSMVNEGHEQGILESTEARMITNIFELNGKQARDVMTHRKSVVFINGEDSLDTVIHFMLTEGNNSRYPVYMETIDNIIGILNMKDALICQNTSEGSFQQVHTLPHLIRDANFIPETRSLDTLFKEMQSNKIHMVVVVDEYGQTAGVVTMEDILEEIVGNIMDEYDVDEELITHLSEDCAIMRGLTPLDDVEEALEIVFDEEEHDNFDTLNGLLISKLDRIPEDGETFTLSLHGYDFHALHVENRLIETIKVIKREEINDAEDRAGAT